jgi:hypothetical protein
MYILSEFSKSLSYFNTIVQYKQTIFLIVNDRIQEFHKPTTALGDADPSLPKKHKNNPKSLDNGGRISFAADEPLQTWNLSVQVQSATTR